MIRFFDILLSFSALMVFSIIFLPVMVILKFTGEGEVFYLQKRTGLNGDHFDLIKFATMLKNSPNIGTGEITVRGDARVLPFGRFLRKTKINELPQLFNILRGDMSVVGPRPLIPSQFAYYDDDVQKIITSVPPGLTGVGSVVFRDEEQFFSENEDIDPVEIYSKKIIPIKGQLEKWYVERRNFKLYVMLILATVIAIVFPKFNFMPHISKDIESLYSELLQKTESQVS